MLAALIDRVELKEDGMRLRFRVAIPLQYREGERTDHNPLYPYADEAPRRRAAARHRGPRPSRNKTRPNSAQGRRAGPSLVSRSRLAAERHRSLRSARAGVTARYVRRLLSLPFLAPAIIEAVVEGRQPRELTAQTLLERTALPLDWTTQKRMLGFE